MVQEQTKPLLYKYPVESLHAGSSLGNRYSFARLDAQSNLKGLWSSADNQYYAGEWNVGIRYQNTDLQPTETLFTPASQTTLLTNEVVKAERQFFLPWSHEQSMAERSPELQAAVFLVRVHNTASHPVDIGIHHSIIFPAVQSEIFTKQPSPEQTSTRVAVQQREECCEITTVGRTDEARVFGSSTRWSTCSADDRTLKVGYDLRLSPGESCERSFVLSFSPEGVESALKGFARCQDARGVLKRTINAYDEILSQSYVMTPEPVINRALQWAKVNTVRVQHNYHIGRGFTNDPPQDIVVIRDVAWYVLGSDYITPQFSHDLLHLAERHAFHDGGKLTEYIHANEDPPALHDYHLNINDDTPLLVYAQHHHALMCETESSTEQVFPAMKRACDWILSQIQDGLVRCHADGTGVWGICSWRNIIDGYNLTGAVTEINAECYHALMLTAETANALGKTREAEHYLQVAAGLKEAINTDLISEKTGLYLLNIGNDNLRHHDVTGDLIFPVMFSVSDEDMRSRIVKKLTDDQMWTPYGSRTVSPEEKNFDPESSYQLLGGVWPNLTAWIAYCLRSEYPEKLVEAMLNIYRLSETERPVDFGRVVPGEFPERLNGITYQSRGMTMSPWTPPTFLWLGMEGLLGARPTFTGLELNPCIPAHWKWIGVKNLPFRGDSICAFLYDGTLYSTHAIASAYPLTLGARLNTRSDNENIFTIGMSVGSDVLVFASADEDAEGKIVVEYCKTKTEKHVRLAGGEGVLLRMPGVNRKDP